MTPSTYNVWKNVQTFYVKINTSYLKMLFHKPDEVKTQMSRQKGDDKKLREKHTSTVSCDWSPNSVHIQWRNPHAVVQEL